MKLSWQDIKKNALAFARRWRFGHSENAESQSFVSEMLNVFGLDAHKADGGFEYKVPLKDGSSGLIDFFWKKMIAIEMKSKGNDLNKAYSQLKNYLQAVPEPICLTFGWSAISKKCVFTGAPPVRNGSFRQKNCIKKLIFSLR
jgi:hypothetical protein